MISIMEKGVASNNAFLERSATFARPLIRNQYFAESAQFRSSSRRGSIYVAKRRVQMSGGGLVVEASKRDMVEQELDGEVDSHRGGALHYGAFLATGVADRGRLDD